MKPTVGMGTVLSIGKVVAIENDCVKVEVQGKGMTHIIRATFGEIVVVTLVDEIEQRSHEQFLSQKKAV